ncbi:MAG TPA: CDP-alcohol phosphatidyltransferase family protein [Thermoanaerobaculia bacterium]|nr:CDP-alcohol phosphatidyltransferase family protein [Thermoanaerobaculia bacterium]
MNLTLPNLLSLLRMGLTPIFVIAVVDGKPLRALLIFGVAGITDALDGFIARTLGQKSLLGAYLDPIADKLLLMSAYVTLAIPGLHPGVLIPLWVTILVIARDVVIVVVALILYLAVGVSRFPPTPLSKVNTAVQVGAAVVVLATGFLPVFDELAVRAIHAVAALTILSGVSYILVANRLGAAARPAG